MCSHCFTLFLSHPFLFTTGSIVYLGMMVGAFFWGGMADKVGRRQCLLICMSINGFFAFLSSFVQGYGFFLLCRVIAGFGWVCFLFHTICGTSLRYYIYQHFYPKWLTNGTLDHKTSLKSLGYICSNSQKYIEWVKLLIFLLCQKY